jgi:hypothetical protein
MREGVFFLGGGCLQWGGCLVAGGRRGEIGEGRVDGQVIY